MSTTIQNVVVVVVLLVRLKQKGKRMRNNQFFKDIAFGYGLKCRYDRSLRQWVLSTCYDNIYYRVTGIRGLRYKKITQIPEVLFHRLCAALVEKVQLRNRQLDNYQPIG